MFQRSSERRTDRVKKSCVRKVASLLAQPLKTYCFFGDSASIITSTVTRHQKARLQVSEAAETQYADERSLDEAEDLATLLPGGSRAIRIDWGRVSPGRTNLPLNASGVSPDTMVFASVGESIVQGDTTAGKFIGAAVLSVLMVTTPRVGRIEVQVRNEFDVPARCQVDYLIVPRF